MRIWPRVLRITAVAVASCLLLGVMVVSSRAAQRVQDLATIARGATVPPLRVGTTYGASLIDPTLNLTPAVRGWGGGQLATHKGGKVRYESAIFFWHDGVHEVDIRLLSGDVDVPRGHARATALAHPRLGLLTLPSAQPGDAVDDRRPEGDLLRRDTPAAIQVDAGGQKPTRAPARS